MRTRNFTTPAYFPREGPHPTMKFNDRLVVSYTVWDQPNASDAPASHERFNLLFLHGSQMMKEIWTYYAELAFKKWGSKLDKVVALDAVSHGESARLNETKITAWSSWADIGRDAGLVLDDLAHMGELDGPTIATGHSMGGAGTMFLATLHTSKIDGVILMDPVWGGSWPENIESKNPATMAIGQMFEKVYKNSRDEFDSREEYEKFMKTRFISRKFHPRIQADMIAHNAYTDFEGKTRIKTSKALQVGAYISASSITRAASTVFRWTPVPALVLRGDVEDWNPPGDMQNLADKLPKAEIKVIEGGGHLVFFEKPDETFAAMTDFIDQQVGAAFRRRKAYEVNAEVGSYAKEQIENELKLMVTKGTRTSFAKL